MTRQTLILKLLPLFALLISNISFANQKIVVADNVWPPFTVGNCSKGIISGGKAVDIIKLIFSELDEHDVSFECMPWKRALFETKMGNVDAVAILQKTPEREKYLEFTTPLFESNTVFFYNADKYKSGVYWNTIRDLQPYRIGVISGYTSEKILRNYNNYGINLNIVPITGKDSQVFQMLLKERVDIFPTNEVVGNQLIKDNNWGKVIKKAPRPIYKTVYHMAFSKAKNHTDLINKINAAIKKLNGQGQIQKILLNDN